MVLGAIFGPSSDSFFSPVFLSQIAQHLSPAVAPFLVALVLAGVLCPAAIVLARRTGLMDHPDGERRIHARPTPLLGGLVLCAAFTLSVLVFWGVRGRVGGIVLVGILAAAVLILDDRFGLSAGVKLTLQVALALLAVVVFGESITFVGLPRVGIVQLGWIAGPLTVFWLLGTQNTVNLLDGVDGLASGVAAIVAVTLLIAAAGRGETEVVIATAALTGACVGFLLFNFHPARIFMGDSGSHFLGLTLGLLSIIGGAKGATVFALIVPVLALAIPIVDTALAILRRRRGGLSIAHPDSRHIHHQLLDFGLTQRQTCLVIYSGTAILGACGLMLYGHRRILAVVIVLLVVVLSTAIGDRLQHSDRRLPGAALKRFLTS